MVSTRQLMDEDLKGLFTKKVYAHIGGCKQKYLPLCFGMVSSGFPRCKKWRIIINSELESDTKCKK